MNTDIRKIEHLDMINGSILYDYLVYVNYTSNK